MRKAFLKALQNALYFDLKTKNPCKKEVENAFEFCEGCRLTAVYVWIAAMLGFWQ